MKKIFILVILFFNMGCAYITYKTLPEEKEKVEVNLNVPFNDTLLEKRLSGIKISLDTIDYDTEKRIFTIYTNVKYKYFVRKQLLTRTKYKVRKIPSKKPIISSLFFSAVSFIFALSSDNDTLSQVALSISGAEIIDLLIVSFMSPIDHWYVYSDNVDTVTDYAYEKAKVNPEEFSAYLKKTKLKTEKQKIILPFNMVKDSSDILKFIIYYETFKDSMLISKEHLFRIAASRLYGEKEYKRAAYLYIKLKDFKQAAQCFEICGEYKNAAKYYSLAGDSSRANLMKILSPHCKGSIGSFMDFLRAIRNPYAYKGKCFEAMGLKLVQMVTPEIGVFSIDIYNVVLRFKGYKNSFQGFAITRAYVKCLGTVGDYYGYWDLTPMFDVLTYWSF